MEVLDLIGAARLAGLRMLADGSELVIRGPGKLADLAQRLIDNKTAVLVAIKPAKQGDGRNCQRHARRLIGCRFAPKISRPPPPSIWADPIVRCARCNKGRVLPELKA